MVKEQRPYAKWGPSTKGRVGIDTGIMAAKAELNKLHTQLASQGFNQVGVFMAAELKLFVSLDRWTL